MLWAWIDPGAADRARLQQQRLAARLARTNAEAAVTRWLSEPELRYAPNYVARRADPGMRREAVLGFLAAIRSFVQALLTLQVSVPEGGPGHPEVEPLAAQLRDALRSIAGRLRGEPTPGVLADLRATQLALDPGDGPEALVLVAETDHLVNSLNTAGHWLGLEPSYEASGPVG